MFDSFLDFLFRPLPTWVAVPVVAFEIFLLIIIFGVIA